MCVLGRALSLKGNYLGLRAVWAARVYQQSVEEQFLVAVSKNNMKGETMQNPVCQFSCIPSIPLA